MTTTTPTIALTQFPPLDGVIVIAGRTPGCNGGFDVSAHPEGVELRPAGCDELCGPPDDGDSPNSGTITGLSPREARELAAVLLKAASMAEAKAAQR
jgi:hypothetical protein